MAISSQQIVLKHRLYSIFSFGLTRNNSAIKQGHDQIETASNESRIEQGSNRDRTRIEQGQIPCLIPVSSELYAKLIRPCFEPAPIQSPASTKL
jgi:hypothetical protein